MLKCPHCGGPVKRQQAEDCDCSGPLMDFWFECAGCGRVWEPEDVVRDGIDVVPELPRLD